jgi:hypothetical protein
MQRDANQKASPIVTWSAGRVNTRVRQRISAQAEVRSPGTPPAALTARRYRYHPARYMKGPPQVHPRSVGGRRKLTPHRPAGSCLSVAGRCVLQPMCKLGGHGLPLGVVSPKRYPDISRVLVSARGSRGPRVGQDPRSASIFWEPDGLFTEDGAHRNPGNKRFVEPPASASSSRTVHPNSPPGRVHDRGRCPLYVRAQLETAGLPWTQRDSTSPKATAREAGNPQLTGRFRR